MSHNPLGLIGLGLVGSALAQRFFAAGFTVHGYDIDATARSTFAQQGGIAQLTPLEVATHCRRIVLSLPTSDIVRDVIAQIESTLQPGDIIIDTTTGEPDAMAQLGHSLQQRGVAYLDATIAGSSDQVRAGNAIVLLGGDATAVNDATEVLGAFAKKTFHLGPCGSGARMKLVVNLVLGLNRAVLAEGLAFAKKCGIDPESALGVLTSSPAFSQVMETKGGKMLGRDFEPQARLSQHLKDVRLILAESAKHGAKTPLSELHRALLQSLEDAGFGPEDNAAIIRAFD